MLPIINDFIIKQFLIRLTTGVIPFTTRVTMKIHRVKVELRAIHRWKLMSFCKMFAFLHRLFYFGFQLN